VHQILTEMNSEYFHKYYFTVGVRRWPRVIRRLAARKKFLNFASLKFPVLVNQSDANMVSKVPYLSLILAAIAVSGADGDGDWKKDALDAHNKFRAKHGASCLVLDDKLSEDAQRCAEYLASTRIFAHVCTGYFHLSVGENLYKSWSPDGRLSGATEAASIAVNGWYSEVQWYKNNKCINDKCGHFTQLVWKDSARLGLGYATNSDHTEYIVAHYDPPGNYPEQFEKNVKDLTKEGGSCNGLAGRRVQLGTGVLIASTCAIVSTML